MKKLCKRCGKTRRLSLFSLSNKNRDKLNTICRYCSHEIYKATYSPEKRRLQAQRHRIKCSCGGLKSHSAKMCRGCLFKLRRDGVIVVGRPFQKGSNHPMWRGGITGTRDTIENTKEYKLWRVAVFERDNYTCVWCGQRGGNLNADHIKPFALFPELRFAIDNGRTLCINCHRTTETYGARTNHLRESCYWSK